MSNLCCPFFHEMFTKMCLTPSKRKCLCFGLFFFFFFKLLLPLSSESFCRVTTPPSSVHPPSSAQWPRWSLAGEISSHLSLLSSSPPHPHPPPPPPLLFYPPPPPPPPLSFSAQDVLLSLSLSLSLSFSLSPALSPQHFCVSFFTLSRSFSSYFSPFRLAHSLFVFLRVSLTKLTYSGSPKRNTPPGAVCLARCVCVWVCVCACMCVCQRGDLCWLVGVKDSWPNKACQGHTHTHTHTYTKTHKHTHTHSILRPGESADFALGERQMEREV